MKRFAWLTALIALVVTGLFFVNLHLTKEQEPAGNSGSSAKTLNIYNWGDYIDPALIKKFEKQTGYKVIYNTFDSNEAMYTKVKQGGTSYDLVVPSDYMVEKMANEGLLIKLDHSKLTGLKNYDPRLMNLSYDPGNQYSVPYFWGTLGVVYNDKYIKPGEIKTWNDLWKPQYKNSIFMLDSSRDTLAVGLASIGKSVNAKSLGDLMAAKGKLEALSPNIKALLNDEIKVYMARNEAPLAVDYSGDAAEMMAENSHLHYVVPSDGGNLWFDNMAIPKTAKNLAGAYAFMNFISNAKNNEQNTEYVGYATPNMAARKLLPKDVSTDKEWYPDNQTMSRLEVYDDLGQKWTEKYSDAFLEFKMAKR
ncbi:MAG TPA: ABC transporter substrate-binding protein [Lactobacillaceae bacterium]|jgi:spermidine/putrescine transport system substrate-binding protein